MKNSKKVNVVAELGEEIVLDLENEAENANYHDICSIYRSLYEILLETVNEEDACKVMKKIQERGGFLL
jgi:hypothetical protein